MAEILTCRLKFVRFETVFHSEEFHTLEAARDVGELMQDIVKAEVSIVDAAGQTVEVLQ